MVFSKEVWFWVLFLAQTLTLYISLNTTFHLWDNYSPILGLPYPFKMLTIQGTMNLYHN